MKSSWINGLDDGQKQEIRGDFTRALHLRKRAIELINEKIETNRTSVRNKDNYDKPNFGVLVADSVGYERALIEVISLLTSEGKED